MYEAVCVATTILLIDFEANHRVSKHPSQNITLKPFSGLPAMLLCFISVIFSSVRHFTNTAFKAQ